VSNASLPSLLKHLQDEWDATMLNNFTLRQELKTVREELTHALFQVILINLYMFITFFIQNDAACRVINRLSSELQQARQIIANLPQGRRNIESEAEITDVEMHQEDQGDGFPGVSDDLINVCKTNSRFFYNTVGI
jgi:pre-mRNA-processing factor 19